MVTLQFDETNLKDLKVLCLGAHSDDIEIGCGGTILKLIQQYPNAEFYWVVFGASGEREREARSSAEVFLQGAAKKKIVTKGFRDGFFPSNNAEIKELFEEIKREISPTLVLTHYRDDRHQDHRVISDLTWNTFRDHFVLEYEIIKYDGDLGTPNLFVKLDDTLCQKKVRYLMDNFGTQRSKHWFTEDTFFSMLRIRGIESAGTGRYAEGFYARKIVL